MLCFFLPHYECDDGDGTLLLSDRLVPPMRLQCVIPQNAKNWKDILQR